MIKAIFFDVANTLLEVSDLPPTIRQTLLNHGIDLDENKIHHAHKFLSETTDFPDKTTKDFYLQFNENLLHELGHKATDQLVEDIYQNCRKLEWKPFNDAEIIKHLNLPLGIASNWDLSLKQKLGQHFDKNFKWIVGSEEIGIQKPEKAFFMYLLDITGLSADEIVFVGDSLKLDIYPALSVGINAILVDRIDFYKDYDGKKVRGLKQIIDLI